MNAPEEFAPITLRASDVAALSDARAHLHEALAALQSLQLPSASVVNQNAAEALANSQRQITSITGVVSHLLERPRVVEEKLPCH